LSSGLNALKLSDELKKNLMDEAQKDLEDADED